MIANRNEKEGRMPDFFIVGAPKCGTTAMCSYLGQHPNIFVGPKEIHYFGSDLDFKGDRITLDKYLSLFAKAAPEVLVGEGSVWYLFSEKAAAEIKALCPSAKIIIMLRNPIDAIYSQHSQFLYNGNEDIEDFNEALNAEAERKKGLRIPNHVLFIKGLFYRETVRYAEQVKRYFDVFGRDNVNVIIYDDFRSQTAEVYKKTLNYLGVDTEFVPHFQVINPNKKFRSAVLQRMLGEDAPAVVQWGRDLFPSFLKRRMKQWLLSMNIRYVVRPEMPIAIRKQLQQELASEVHKLSDLLGRDFTHWLKQIS